MTQAKETITFVLSLLITGGTIAGGYWLYTQSNNKNDLNVTQQEQSNNFGVKNVPSGLFNYGGSTTWAPIRRDVDSEIQKAYPTFQLRYTDPISEPPGSIIGIRMLLNNQLTFAQSSQALKIEDFKELKNKPFTLEEIPVAIDGIVMAVHPDLDIAGLTVQQIKGIYTGKITNWSEVGGPDLAIIPYSRSKEAGGTVEFFIENVLQKQEFGNNVKKVFSTTDGLRQVGQNKGGIYYGSAPEIVPQCTVKSIPVGILPNQFVPPYQQPFVPLSDCPNQRNQLNESAFQNGTYPITRRLFVVIKKNGQLDEEAGRAYSELLLSERGQELIEKAGFVRIK